jgi:transcriptional regulator with XRE-family HTH domain
VNKTIERLKGLNEDARYAYADSISNTFLTAQIKTLQEKRGLTQEQLAELVGTQQSGISRWLNTGFATCKIESLRKFAKAYGVRLRISFEEFGTLPTDVEGFTKEKLAPRRFEEDPAFSSAKEREPEGSVAISAAEKNLRETLGRDLTADELEIVHQHNEGRARAAARNYALTIKPGAWNTLQQIAASGPAAGLLESPEWFTETVEAGNHAVIDYLTANNFRAGNLKGLAGPSYIAAPIPPLADQYEEYRKSLARETVRDQTIPAGNCPMAA